MLFPDSLVDEFILALAALLIALAVIYRFARGVYNGVKRIEAALGVDAKGRTIADRLDTVEHQLFPNGGTSLADKVVSIDVRQVALETQMGTVERMLAGVIRRQNGKDF